MKVRVIADADWLSELDAHLRGTVTRADEPADLLVVPWDAVSDVLDAFDDEVSWPVRPAWTPGPRPTTRSVGSARGRATPMSTTTPARPRGRGAQRAVELVGRLVGVRQSLGVLEDLAAHGLEHGQPVQHRDLELAPQLVHGLPRPAT